MQNTTIQFGMKVGNPVGIEGVYSESGAETDADTADGEIPVEVQYLFFLEEDGCLALFELLLSHPALMGSTRLDKLALMNAIWRYHPDYALTHNFQK